MDTSTEEKDDQDSLYDMLFGDDSTTKRDSKNNAKKPKKKSNYTNTKKLTTDPGDTEQLPKKLKNSPIKKSSFNKSPEKKNRKPMHFPKISKHNLVDNQSPSRLLHSTEDGEDEIVYNMEKAKKKTPFYWSNWNLCHHEIVENMSKDNNHPIALSILIPQKGNKDYSRSPDKKQKPLNNKDNKNDKINTKGSLSTEVSETFISPFSITGSFEDVKNQEDNELINNKTNYYSYKLKRFILQAYDLVDKRISVYPVKISDFDKFYDFLVKEHESNDVIKYFDPNSIRWWRKHINKLILIFDKPSGDLSIIIDKKLIHKLVNHKMKYHKWMEQALIDENLSLKGNYTENTWEEANVSAVDSWDFYEETGVFDNNNNCKVENENGNFSNNNQIKQDLNGFDENFINEEYQAEENKKENCNIDQQDINMEISSAQKNKKKYKLKKKEPINQDNNSLKPRAISADSTLNPRNKFKNQKITRLNHLSYTPTKRPKTQSGEIKYENESIKTHSTKYSTVRKNTTELLEEAYGVNSTLKIRPKSMQNPKKDFPENFENDNKSIVTKVKSADFSSKIDNSFNKTLLSQNPIHNDIKLSLDTSKEALSPNNPLLISRAFRSPTNMKSADHSGRSSPSRPTIPWASPPPQYKGPSSLRSPSSPHRRPRSSSPRKPRSPGKSPFSSPAVNWGEDDELGNDDDDPDMDSLLGLTKTFVISPGKLTGLPARSPFNTKNFELQKFGPPRRRAIEIIKNVRNYTSKTEKQKNREITPQEEKLLLSPFAVRLYVPPTIIEESLAYQSIQLGNSE